MQLIEMTASGGHVRLLYENAATHRTVSALDQELASGGTRNSSHSLASSGNSACKGAR
jgi:hypothetical protein